MRKPKMLRVRREFCVVYLELLTHVLTAHARRLYKSTVTDSI